MDRLYKILIIDDDEYSADNLCLELKRYGQLMVEGIARNGSNGKKMIDKLRPDILFLDVELPDMKEMDEPATPMAIPPQVYSTGEHTFMISTPTNDLRVLRSIDIGFFRYNSDRKLWEVVLNNQVPLLLKKNTTAHQITEYAPCFVQIHQSYIININYLIMIKENRCVMYPPFEKITELIVSKKFKKTLQDSFYQL